LEPVKTGSAQHGGSSWCPLNKLFHCSLPTTKIFPGNPNTHSKGVGEIQPLPPMVWFCFYFILFCVENLSPPSKRIHSQNDLLQFKNTIETKMEQRVSELQLHLWFLTVVTKTAANLHRLEKFLHSLSLLCLNNG